MRLTLAEIFNEWQEEWLTSALLLIAMVILTVLIQFKIIIIPNLIYDQTEESPGFVMYESLRLMRVLTTALTIFAIIIQL